MGTHYQGTLEEKTALDTFIALTRALNSIGKMLKRNRFGQLTPSQFGVMEALLHLGPLTQKQLAQKILRSSGNMVTVIDNLAQKGLITREPVPGDRRSVHVTLTEPGKILIDELFQKHVEGIQNAFSVLSLAEQQQLKALCKRVGLHNANQTEKMK